MNGIRAQLGDGTSKRRGGGTRFKVARERLRSPEIDAETSTSALGALATGLASIGDRFARRRRSLRVL
jgi:hypothetical protein